MGHMAPPPPKLHNMIGRDLIGREKKPLFRAHSARATQNQPLFSAPRRESLGGYGTNGSGRSSSRLTNKTKASRCLNPTDDPNEIKRNEQIKGNWLQKPTFQPKSQFFSPIWLYLKPIRRHTVMNYFVSNYSSWPSARGAIDSSLIVSKKKLAPYDPSVFSNKSFF